MENLYDLCCDYIENSHTLEGIKTAKEQVYNDCCEYINMQSDCPKYITERLRKQFSKYLN
jgi:hypothetical protein